MKKLLSPPTTPVFFISVAIAVIAVLANQHVVSDIPLEPFWILGIGYGVLAAACLFRRM